MQKYPECLIVFQYDDKVNWVNGIAQPIPIYCSKCQSQVAYKAPQCNNCGLELVWPSKPLLSGEAIAKTQPCPSCQNPLEYGQKRCEHCGVKFIIDNFGGWQNDKAEVKTTPNLEPGCQPNPTFDDWFDGLSEYDCRLIVKGMQQWNLSQECVVKIFNPWKGEYANPLEILKTFFQEINRFSFIQEHIGTTKYQMTLEQALGALISTLLEKDPATLSDIEKVTKEVEAELSVGSSYKNGESWISNLTGGGWLPAYDKPVQIIPPNDYNVLSGRVGWKFGCDVIIDKWRKENVFASAVETSKLCCFRLALNEKEDLTPGQMESFWSSTGQLSRPVSFEIVGNGTAGTIGFQLICHVEDKAHIANQLVALFPNSTINPQGNDEDFLLEQSNSASGKQLLSDFSSHAIGFGLTGWSFDYPLRTLTRFDKTDHLYVVGKTGTGKTTFLYNLIKTDIDAGKGVGLIDPHGDLVESVLRAIPQERVDDVIVFDLSDYEHPIGFNMFQVGSSLERRQMRSDILVAIRRLFESSSWGDNIDQLFRASIATLLADSNRDHTLLDIRRLMSDEVFRSQVVGRIDDDFLLEFWRDDFPAFTRTTISAVRRRLGSILNEAEVRNVLAQPKTSFNFKQMMDTKKIFLAKISRGTLGEDISRLFGGLLVSKIQLTAMARESQPEAERVPFYLYVDEFQNFVNEGFEIILSEARKYRLSLTMAHQFTAQLPNRLYNAVFGNVGSLVVFETGVDDAAALEKQLGRFSTQDILNLERFHTFTRIGKAKDAFSMRTLPPPETVGDMSERVRAASRAKYCRATGAPQTRESQPSEPEPSVREQPTGRPEHGVPSKSGQNPQTVEEKLAHLLEMVRAFGAQMEADGLLASSDVVVRAYATQLYGGLGLPASHQEQVIEEIIDRENVPDLQRLCAIVRDQAASEPPAIKTQESGGKEKDEPVKKDKLDFFE